MWPFKNKSIVFSKYKYSDYLPVGTIVKVYNDDNVYMISRYLGNFCMTFSYNNKQLILSRIYNHDENYEKIHYHVDYELIPYPYNFDYKTYYVLHDDIKEIIYLGYNDEYRKNIMNDIDRWYHESEEK